MGRIDGSECSVLSTWEPLTPTSGSSRKGTRGTTEAGRTTRRRRSKTSCRQPNRRPGPPAGGCGGRRTLNRPGTSSGGEPAAGDRETGGEGTRGRGCPHGAAGAGTPDATGEVRHEARDPGHCQQAAALAAPGARGGPLRPLWCAAAAVQDLLRCLRPPPATVSTATERQPPVAPRPEGQATPRIGEARSRMSRSRLRERRRSAPERTQLPIHRASVTPFKHAARSPTVPQLCHAATPTPAGTSPGGHRQGIALLTPARPGLCSP
jgi:hypothetical protein